MSFGKYNFEEFGLDPDTVNFRLQGIHKQFNDVNCCNAKDSGNVTASDHQTISHPSHKSAMNNMKDSSDYIGYETRNNTVLDNDYDDIEAGMYEDDDYDDIEAGMYEDDEDDDIEAGIDTECSYKRGKGTKSLRKKAAKGTRSTMSAEDKKKMRKSLLLSMKKHNIKASLPEEESDEDSENIEAGISSSDPQRRMLERMRERARERDRERMREKMRPKAQHSTSHSSSRYKRWNATIPMHSTSTNHLTQEEDPQETTSNLGQTPVNTGTSGMKKLSPSRRRASSGTSKSIKKYHTKAFRAINRKPAQ